MKHRTNLVLELVPGRVERLLKELDSRIWETAVDLPAQIGPLNDPPVELEQAWQQPLETVEAGQIIASPDAEAYGDQCNRNHPWAQRWFRLEVPPADADQRGRRVLFWKCQGESTVYRDGVAWAGIDAGHPYCPLPDEGGELWIEAGLWATAIWHKRQGEYAPEPRGFRFDGASIALRDPIAWESYHDLSVLNELCVEMIRREGYELRMVGRQEQFETLAPRARRLLRRLSDACDSYDRDGLEALAGTLGEIYDENPAARPSLRYATHGHSHLDLVWLWPREVGVRKGVHTCSTALRLMDRYPEFRFMMTQPWLFEQIESRHPELMRQIAGRVEDGRWEFTGGMLVESDTTLPCLEGLIRTLACGQRAFAKLRGGDVSRVCYLPDVFGFSAQLPQLLSQAGVEGFFTTKMNWNRITRPPHDSFLWQSPDGSTVATHLRVAGGLSVASGDKTARAYRQADVHDETYGWFGLGDGGGGPTELDCERMRRYARLADAPAYEYSTTEEFFDRLLQCRDRLPTYTGELYFEYHRGCYTTHSRMKTAFRRAETALQVHEAVRAVTGQGPLGDDAWTPVIYAQFHDAIPGSSIPPVYEELVPELEELAENHLTAAGEELSAGDDGTVSYFNPSPYRRRVLCRLPQGTAALVDDRPLETQPVDDGTLVQLDLPPLSTTVVQTQPSETSPEPSVDSRADQMSNGVLTVRFDETGRLVSLQTAVGEHLCAPAEFMLHADVPAKYEAWDIDQPATWLGRPLGLSGGLTVEEDGPVRWTRAGTLDLGDGSSATVRYHLEAGSPLLHVTLDIDWQESRKLLRYEVPTPYRPRDARFGCPGGSICRAQMPGYLQDEMMWEVPASRWAAITDDIGRSGLAMITEAKYGFSAREGLLGLSLLRSPDAPNASGTEAPAGGADRGRHVIRFALGPFLAEHTPEYPNTPAQAETLYLPVVRVKGRRPLDGPFTIEGGATLVTSWLAPGEDADAGYTIRLHESLGTSGRAVLRFASSPESVEQVDLLGRSIRSLSVEDSRVLLDYAPYKIISLRVRP